MTASAKVAVSGRFLRVSQPTGTQRSSRALLAATLKTGLADILLFGADTQAEFPSLKAVRTVRFRSAVFDHLWEQAIFPLASDVSTLWTLMGSGPLVHPGKRHVMVVHDLNYKLMPHVFGRAFRTWYRFACGAAAQRADTIVCFTNYVSGTLQKHLGIPADRIRVIPQGPGLTMLDKPLESFRLEVPARPYFLCVGSLQPHKNLYTALAAWELFRQRHAGYSLKVVGRAQGKFASLGLDVSELPPDVEFTGYVSDEKLIRLYRSATGFLYPSIEEGFGMPVVESFYCGCPVITSNQSCLPEVAGEAAILVDPHNAAAIADALVLLAESPTTAHELRAKGFRRSKLFTWEKAGTSMAKILRSISSSEST